MGSGTVHREREFGRHTPHDGGVAVGADPNQVGVPRTVLAHVAPDPAQSLRALLDRELCARVVQATTPMRIFAPRACVAWMHAFWVDGCAGYSDEEQATLIRSLLLLP